MSDIQAATVTVYGGSIDLPTRPTGAADATLVPLPPPETALPEPVTEVREDVVRIDRIGLELGTESSFTARVDDHDPLSAVFEMRQTQTIARDGWRIRIETETQLSCTRDAFVVRATMSAWEGDVEVCRRAWDSEVPRDFV